MGFIYFPFRKIIFLSQLEINIRITIPQNEINPFFVKSENFYFPTTSYLTGNVVSIVRLEGYPHIHKVLVVKVIARDRKIN
jgi:hypothetical protein